MTAPTEPEPVQVGDTGVGVGVDHDRDRDREHRTPSNNHNHNERGQQQEEEQEHNDPYILLIPPHLRRRPTTAYGATATAPETPRARFRRSPREDGVPMLVVATFLFAIMAVMVRAAEAPLRLSAQRALFVRALIKLLFAILSLLLAAPAPPVPGPPLGATNDMASASTQPPDAPATGVTAATSATTTTTMTESGPPPGTASNSIAAQVAAVREAATPRGPRPVERALLLAGRAAAGAAALTCYLFAIERLPVGDALAVAFVVPVLTVLAAHFGLGEAVSRMHGVACMLGLCGVILLAMPDELGAVAAATTPWATATAATPPTAAAAAVAVAEGWMFWGRAGGGGWGHAAPGQEGGGGGQQQQQQLQQRLAGTGFALGCAAFSAVAYVAVRRLGEDAGSGGAAAAMLGLAALGVATALGGGLTPAAVMGDTQTRDAVALMALAGVAAFVGQECLRRGVRGCSGRPGILLRNFEVPLVYALAFVALHEVPTVTHLAGAALVVAASLVIGVEHLVRA